MIYAKAMISKYSKPEEGRFINGIRIRFPFLQG
jgi:hypothetical protein